MTLLAELSAPVDKVDEAVTITGATDDQGHDLSAGAAGRLTFLDTAPIDRTYLSKDRKAVGVAVMLKERPAAGARQVTIKGRLSVVQDAEAQTVQVANVPLEIGREIKAGEVTMRVVRLSLGKGGVVTMALRTAQAEAVKGIEFVDGDGKVLAGKRDAATSMRYSVPRTAGGDAAEQDLYYIVGPGVGDSVTMRVSVVVKSQSVEVPFEVTTGIGL